MTDKIREAFEKHFSQPPYEFNIERQGENASWPGNYRVYSVECAWQGYEAAQDEIASLYEMNIAQAMTIKRMQDAFAASGKPIAEALQELSALGQELSPDEYQP